MGPTGGRPALAKVFNCRAVVRRAAGPWRAPSGDPRLPLLLETARGRVCAVIPCWASSRFLTGAPYACLVTPGHRPGLPLQTTLGLGFLHFIFPPTVRWQCKWLCVRLCLDAWLQKAGLTLASCGTPSR